MGSELQSLESLKPGSSPRAQVFLKRKNPENRQRSSTQNTAGGGFMRGAGGGGGGARGTLLIRVLYKIGRATV